LPNIGRLARGLAPNLDLVHSGGARELVAFCTPEGQRRVRERARAAGVTETSLLFAAYAQTLASRGGVDDLMLTVPLALRTDRRLNNFVGYLAGLSFLRASVKRLPDPAMLAADLSDQLKRSTELAPFNYALQKTPVRDEIIGAGSYLALYCTGMQAPDRHVSGASSSAIQRLGGTEELDFGFAKLTPIGRASIVHHSAGVFELDLRSFQGPKGLAYRCAYDVMAFDRPDARDIFAEVLDRLDLGTSGHDGIVSLADESGQPSGQLPLRSADQTQTEA
jgi:hypothetical protein